MPDQGKACAVCDGSVSGSVERSTYPTKGGSTSRGFGGEVWAGPRKNQRPGAIPGSGLLLLEGNEFLSFWVEMPH